MISRHLRAATIAVTAIILAAFPDVGRAQAARREPGPRSRPHGRIIVSNMNDNTASIVDAASGRVLATLPTGQGPHEVAASHDGRWAIVSNYGVRGKPGNSITVIDVPALRVARTIDLGEHQRPHGSRFLPGDSLLAVTSEVSRAVLLVDFKTGAVVRTVPTNGRVSHMLGVSSDGGRAVTSNIADGTISILSLHGSAAPVVVKVGTQPEGVALSADGSFAWAGSNRDSMVLVVDTRRAVVVDTLRGFGLPYRLAISPDGRRAVITDPAKAEVRVFDAAKRQQILDVAIPRDSLVATAEVPGSPSPEGVTISPDSRWAFVTLQGRNRVVTIDLDSGAIVGWAPTGNWSDGIAFSPLER